MRDEFGGGAGESIFFALLVVILMYMVVSGGLFNNNPGPTVIHNPQVSQQVPASGNLMPQVDNHKGE